jgi:hypothetical protein
MQFFIDNICSMARGALSANEVVIVTNAVGDETAALSTAPRATATLVVIGTSSIDTSVANTCVEPALVSVDSQNSALVIATRSGIGIEDVDELSEDDWNGTRICEEVVQEMDEAHAADAADAADEADAAGVHYHVTAAEACIVAKSTPDVGMRVIRERPSGGALVVSACKMWTRSRAAADGPPSRRLRSKCNMPRVTPTSYIRRLRSHALVVASGITRLRSREKNRMRKVTPTTRIWQQRLRGR